MNRSTKTVFIFLLLSISISASIFMIIESGSFFQDLYKNESTISFMGYWAAFLIEVFMGIMAAVWLPGKKTKHREIMHPVNVLFKLLLIFLFLTTVCGSSLKIVYPLFGMVQQQANQKEVIQLLQTQVKDNEKALHTFAQQNQRINAALSVRNQTKVKEELKEILINQKSTLSLWIEMFIVIFIRFGVQLANLSCVWLAGWIYRQPTQKKSVGKLSKASFPVPRPQAKSMPDQAIPDVNGQRLREHQQRSKANGKSQSDNRLSPIKNRKTAAPNVQAIRPGNDKPPIHSARSAKNETIANHQNVYDLRSKIALLLRSRNEGVSLSDVGKAIGERESNLKEIVNPKTRIGNASMPALQNILAKIENLYHEEQTRMY